MLEDSALHCFLFVPSLAVYASWMCSLHILMYIRQPPVLIVADFLRKSGIGQARVKYKSDVSGQLSDFRRKSATMKDCDF